MKRFATELVAEVKKEEPTAPTTLMSFDTFNVTRVLDNGKKLLASGGEVPYKHADVFSTK